MGFENNNQVPSVDESIADSSEEQEVLVKQYLDAYNSSQELQKEWDRLYSARARNEEESGQMPDFEEQNKVYTEDIASVYSKIKAQQEIMSEISPLLTEETKDDYLKPEGSKFMGLDKSPETQESLAVEYLAAYGEYSSLMEQWKNIDAARIRNEEESGHMPDFAEADKRYREDMDSLSTQMKVHTDKISEIMPLLTEETKDAYLKPEATS